jgi:integrase/recombinase XerD
MTPWASAFETARAAFLESLRIRGRAAATLSTRGDGLRKFFGYLAGRGMSEPREVTPATIRDYQQWLAAQPLTAWTRCTHLMAARMFFDYLESAGAILLNPCADMVLPKIGDQLPRAILTRGEARRVLEGPDLATPRGIRDRALLEIFYSTGLRLAEMTALTVHDIGQGVMRVTRGKGARDRMVPLGETAADCLRAYLTQVRAAWRPRPDLRELWLSSDRPHHPISKDAVGCIVKGYLRAAGITSGRAHLWRHTCATHMMNGGAGLATVRQLLGHRSLRSTQIYTRVVPADVRATLAAKHPRP